MELQTFNVQFAARRYDYERWLINAAESFTGYLNGTVRTAIADLDHSLRVVDSMEQPGEQHYEQVTYAAEDLISALEECDITTTSYDGIHVIGFEDDVEKWAEALDM